MTNFTDLPGIFLNFISFRVSMTTGTLVSYPDRVSLIARKSPDWSYYQQHGVNKYGRSLPVTMVTDARGGEANGQLA